MMPLNLILWKLHRRIKTNTLEYCKRTPSNMWRRKQLKRIPQEDEKTTRNQTTQQKPHQSDKYLGCAPRKILGTILNVDEKAL